MHTVLTRNDLLMLVSAYLLVLCLSPNPATALQPPEPTPIQTFHDEGFVPPPTPESAFTHK